MSQRNRGKCAIIENALRMNECVSESEMNHSEKKTEALRA